ncbi:efflux RND transporter permease subunit [Chitinophaga polysaccharea]|uniref:efflux RND transporter permease subunit n=1 Tax=Chitinophaga polysaccharea TaxID=1293035 RepID=UPI001645FD88|nr:efflux RND transporter permease subunit [Chitinophaga polysaccharea]
MILWISKWVDFRVKDGHRAIIALMPIAMGIGTGAQLHQPLAIAVIGGFILALPLLLIVLRWTYCRRS